MNLNLTYIQFFINLMTTKQIVEKWIKDAEYTACHHIDEIYFDKSCPVELDGNLKGECTCYFKNIRKGIIHDAKELIESVAEEIITCNPYADLKLSEAMQEGRFKLRQEQRLKKKEILSNLK